VTILLLLGLLQDIVPDDDIGRGPLHMTSLSPFQIFRPGFVPRAPSELPEGQWEARLTESWANLWAFNEDDLLVDMEVLHSNLGLAVGLGQGWMLELEYENAARFGGFMDSMINSVHDFLGAETRHREDFEEDDFQFVLDGRGDRPSAQLSNRDRGMFVQCFVGTVQWTFSDGGPGRPALAAWLSLRAEIVPNEDLRGGSPVDVAVGLSGAESWGPVILTVATLVAWYGTETFQDIPLEQVQVAGLASVEWPFHKRISMLLQYLCTQGVAEDWLDFSKPSHEIMLGFKIDLNRARTRFEIGALENLAIPDNSPDFGLHAGLSFGF
jgi:hypothetical protein